MVTVVILLVSSLGNEVAEYTRDYFVIEFVKLQSYKDRNFDKALKEIFMLIDDLLETKEAREKLKTYCKSKTREGMDNIGHYAGCTACVGILADGQLIVANAGDSRCVLSINQVATDMSIDHKPDLPTEKLRVEQAGMFVDEQRVNGVLNLSRSLGDLEYK